MFGKKQKHINFELYRYINELQQFRDNYESKIATMNEIEEKRAKIINDHEKGIQMCIEGINEDRLAIQKIIKKLNEKETKSTKTNKRR